MVMLWGFEHITMYIRERDSDAVRGGSGGGRVNKAGTIDPCPCLIENDS